MSTYTYIPNLYQFPSLLKALAQTSGPSPSLDLNFASTLSLTSSSGITPSFSRASTGTYFNSSGVLTSAAINIPRFNHTFNGTSWISRGLLVEEQRTNLFQQSEDFSNAYWVKTNSSILSNSATSPDGNNTADKIVEDTSNNAHYIQKTLGGVYATYSLSIYAKAGGRNWILLGWWDGAANRNAYFNISSGSVGTISGSVSTSIVSVGNGWFRCTVTHTSAISVMYTQCATSDGVSSYTGDGTSGVFIWGAQLEAGAFATSYIPTTSASATRSADVCQITGGDFSSFWNASEGSFAAELDLAAPVTGITYYPFYFGASDTATNTKRIFYFSDIPTGTSSLYLSDGTTTSKLTTSAIPGNSTTFKTAMCYKVDDLAISLNGAAVVTDLSQPIPAGLDRFQIGNNPSANNFNGHIARLRYFNKRLPNATLQQLSEPDPTLNLQFALNKSLTPVAGPAPSFSRASTGTYFNASGVLTSASINTPRFDHVYSGGQWVSRGLLIEEQRTNSSLNSEQFDNATWLKFDSTTTANAGTAPNGTVTADKCVPNTNSANHCIYNSSAISISSGTQYTVSLFAKASGYNFLYLVCNVRGSSSSTGVCVNLTDGTQSNGGASGTYTVTNVGDGWWRIACTATASSTSGYIEIWPRAVAGGATTTVGNGTDGVLIWGAQIETGPFATSYIGTTSSPVVRSADVCQITGTSFNWMWNQGEGSVVAEFDRSMAGSVTSDSMIYIAAGTGAPSNIQNGAYITSANITTYGYDSAFTYNFNHGSQLANTVYKVATAIKLNDFASSLNGLAVLTDNSGTVGTNERLLIGHLDWSGGNRLNGHIAKLIYYPARLTNTKLQQLST